MSILLIGGTDPHGAGLQTDWQVAHYLKIQANSVVTAVTAQNNDGVLDAGVLSLGRVKAQFEVLENSTFSVIKIGMLGNHKIIKAVISFLKTQPAETVVILDPVLASSAGGELLTLQGRDKLLRKLLPLVTLVTPNSEELALLTQSTIENYADIEASAEQLLTLGAKSVLVKGGHFSANKEVCIDYFISATERFYLKGTRWQERNNVRGTGCALASTLACLISQKQPLNDALVVAKAIISSAIRQAIEYNGQNKLFFTPAKTKKILFDLVDLPKLYKNSQDLDHPFDFSSCDTQTLGVYPVVDSAKWIAKLTPLKVKTIQLRMKDKTKQQVEGEIIEAIAIAEKNNSRLFINDYWQLAIKHQAYGIHLGQEDLDQLSADDLNTIAQSGCRLGISSHSYTEIARAHAIKPSYLAFGPVFATTSKDMPWIPQGVDAVADWVTFFADYYPLVAIGGINLERAKDLREVKVGSVAMISAITEAEDYELETKRFINSFEDFR